MTRSIAVARLVTGYHVTARVHARCHRGIRSPAFTHFPCLHRSSPTLSSYIAVRSFSSTPPPPPPPSVTPPTSAAQQSDDSVLAETARLISPSSPSPAPSPDSTVIYTSPFISAVRRMKLFSLSSCALSVASAPLLLLLSSPSIPLSGRLAMCSAVAAFGIGTTLALTKFTQPYVIRVWQPTNQPDTLTFETVNLWAAPRYRTVAVDGLRPLWNRLLSNVRALHVPPASTPYSDYFLHADIVEHPLLKPLVQHSLPLPEEQPETTQQAAEAASAAEQTTTAELPTADTAPKQR